MSLSSINIWKKIMETGDMSKLKNIIHEEAVFYSPILYTPQKGKINVFKYLYSAVKVFEDKKFRYVNSIISKNNLFFAEFSSNINNIEINGVDIIKYERGMIKEFKVFLRPYKGLEIVWDEMKKNLKKYDFISS